MSASRSSRSNGITFKAITDAYIGALKKYAVFKGRSRRREFWVFFICNLILGIIPVIGTIVGIVTFIPSLAVGVRRLHDTNRSGFWLLWAFIPSLAMVVFLMLTIFLPYWGGLGFTAFPNLGLANWGLAAFSIFSRWWIAIAVLGILLIIAGITILIVFWAKEGTAGKNKYGPNPKAKK